MSWLLVVRMFLELAAFFARRAERLDIERNILNEIELLQKKRVDRAADARDDVIAGRMPVDPDDPYRRD